MKGLLTILCALYCFQLNAQTSDTLTSEELTALVNKQFRLIVGENTNGGFGSFAGLDLSESKRVAFSPAFILDTGNILAFKIGAGYSDGISDLFKNSKINSNVSLDADYHFLPRVRHSAGRHAFRNVEVVYSSAEFYEFQGKRDAADSSDIIDRIGIECSADYYAFMDGLRKRLKELQEQEEEHCKVLDSIFNVEEWTDNTMTRQQMIDWYNCEDEKITAEYIIASKKIAENSSLARWQLKTDLLRSKKYSEARNPYENANLSVTGFKFGWFSIGAGIRRDDFKLFDPTAAYSSRVTDEDFTSFQARAKYSFFSWAETPGSEVHTFYWSTGITYNYKSNYLDLSSTEITKTSYLGADTTKPASQLDKIEAFNAYEGNYKEKIHELVLNGELYYFFLDHNVFAIHVYGDLRFVDDTQSLNLGAGVLFPFQDKEKEKSIVNAELYWSFSDLFQTSKGYKEDKVGLRFSFPINFNPKKAE